MIFFRLNCGPLGPFWLASILCQFNNYLVSPERFLYHGSLVSSLFGPFSCSAMLTPFSCSTSQLYIHLSHKQSVVSAHWLLAKFKIGLLTLEHSINRRQTYHEYRKISTLSVGSKVSELMRFRLSHALIWLAIFFGLHRKIGEALSHQKCTNQWPICLKKNGLFPQTLTLALGSSFSMWFVCHSALHNSPALPLTRSILMPSKPTYSHDG